jgi:hypothetical protein
MMALMRLPNEPPNPTCLIKARNTQAIATNQACEDARSNDPGASNGLSPPPLALGCKVEVEGKAYKERPEDNALSDHERKRLGMITVAPADKPQDTGRKERRKEYVL